jgi:hypothetical protein
MHTNCNMSNKCIISLLWKHALYCYECFGIRFETCVWRSLCFNEFIQLWLVTISYDILFEGGKIFDWLWQRWLQDIHTSLLSDKEDWLFHKSWKQGQHFEYGRRMVLKLRWWSPEPVFPVLYYLPNFLELLQTVLNCMHLVIANNCFSYARIAALVIKVLALQSGHMCGHRFEPGIA